MKNRAATRWGGREAVILLAAALAFLPCPSRSAPVPVPGEPAQPARALFEESPVRFVSKETNIDGIMTLPRGGWRVPYRAVLFVHGAGPLDRDETVGPNRPFYELARGLAVNGIASFRYDKRSLAAPQTLSPRTMTVREEVIDDAVAALDFLRYQSGIDSRKICILGHDLGGSLAPMIANAAGHVAGLIILAGSLRPLDEILPIDSLRSGMLPANRLILGMGERYLEDYRALDLRGSFRAFPGPILILQGGKDHRITRRDMDLWRETAASAGKSNVTFKDYPNLGHLFIPIAGDSSPETFLSPGNLDPGVIADIAGFVRSIN